MFHGSITKLYNEKMDKDKFDEFQVILDDFTNNFNRYFFAQEYAKNLMWNLCF